MHETGLLGRLLPEFGRLTCQVQHDLYHRYTTDEHTLLALGVLDQIASEKVSKHGPYQKILNEVFDASSLYFALLMHDIGKGLGGGHAEKGAKLAAQADALAQYEGLYATGLVKHCCCWAHARRYFFKALDSDPERAKVALHGAARGSAVRTWFPWAAGALP